MKIKFVLILASLMLVMGIQSLAIGAEKDLVGLWAFDEGTGNKVKDLSGNGNDGTISGAKWVDGKFGKAWGSIRVPFIKAPTYGEMHPTVC